MKWEQEFLTLMNVAAHGLGGAGTSQFRGYMMFHDGQLRHAGMATVHGQWLAGWNVVPAENMALALTNCRVKLARMIAKYQAENPEQKESS